MAHTDNTLPRRLWDYYGLTFTSSYKCYYANSHRSDTKDYVREFNRRDRHNARAALRRGEEPQPIQPRGRAKYDAW